MAQESKMKPGQQDDKLKALDAALSHIERQYGKGSVMKLGEAGKNMNVETVPTGSLSLDIALGLGGIPKGRKHAGLALPRIWQAERSRSVES